MRKKSVLAMIMLCAMLGTTACGAADTQESTTESEVETTQDTAETTETAEEAAEETSEEEEVDTAIGRLVTIQDVTPYVNLGEYKGITLEKDVTIVTDEEIEENIKNTLQASAEEVTEEGASVQDGDIVNMDCTGTIDGVAFTTGVEEDSTLIIGSGSFIDGFEAAMIGMTVGETRDIPLTFPEDYWSEDYAGKEAVFTVTLNAIHRAPELTDEWVTANTTNANVEEYREAIRADLQSAYDESAEDILLQLAWTEVAGAAEIIEYPEEELADAVALAHEEMETLAASYGMELSEFIEAQGMTEEELTTLETQYAQESLKQNLIVQGIIDAENIDLTDEKTQEIINELLTLYGVDDLSVLINQYGKIRVDSSIALRRVEYFLVENAVIQEASEEEETDAEETEQVDEELSEGTEIVGEDSVDNGAAPVVQSDEGAEEAVMDGDGTTDENAFEENGIAVVEDDGEAE